MATSTPNEWIQSLAEKYEIPLYINTGDSGIAQDWNFAYRQAKTDYVTIAHQDDTYEPDYLKMVMKGLKKAKDPIIAYRLRRIKGWTKSPEINIADDQTYIAAADTGKGISECKIL